MRASRGDMPAATDTTEVRFQEAEWGDMHAAFETFHSAMDITELLKGLPGDLCPCPHWGYVLKGRMSVRYADHAEDIDAGDAYYLAPGHTLTIEAGTETVEFSPKDTYRRTVEAVSANLQALEDRQ